jgi:hypothetical protein
MTAFLAQVSTTQSLSGNSTAAVNFGTEVFDPDNVFASNVLIIPAGWDGRTLELFAGVRFSASISNANLILHRSTDNGSSWADLATCRSQTNAEAINVASGPILVSEGHRFRVAVRPGVSATVANNPATFFGGCLVPVNPARRALARVRNSTTQVVADGGFDQVTLSTARYDTDNMLVSSQLIVPTGFPSGYGVIVAGMRWTLTGRGGLYIQQSKDEGATWGIAGSGVNAQHIVGGAYQRAVAAPAKIDAGDRFRLMCFNNVGAGSSRTIADTAGYTFMAADIWGT